jgi:hypothetical protein
MLSTTTKVKLGAKGVRAAARHPGLVRAGAKGGTGMARIAAKATMPIVKRTAPKVAAGAVLGASAMYFLEPEHGKEHREKVAQLVSS